MLIEKNVGEKEGKQMVQLIEIIASITGHSIGCHYRWSRCRLVQLHWVLFNDTSGYQVSKFGFVMHSEGEKVNKC